MTDPMNDAQELRAAVDLVGLGRYRQDPVTQIIEWDSRLKAMWGLPPDAAVCPLTGSRHGGTRCPPIGGTARAAVPS